MARTRHKAATVVITCAAPDCTRRVRRKRGTRYCGSSCRQAAYRARVDRSRVNARRAQLAAERARLKVLDAAKAKALAQLFKRRYKVALQVGYNTGDLHPSFEREKAAIRAADTAGELSRIQLDGEAERAPLIQEAAKRPPKRNSVKPTALRLKDLEDRQQRRQRQPKPKRHKSPLEGGSVEGQRKQTGPRIVVTRGP